jgi:hypothetical protein
VDEDATTANDDIEFVLFVWRLLVRRNGDGEFDIEVTCSPSVPRRQ